MAAALDRLVAGFAEVAPAVPARRALPAKFMPPVTLSDAAASARERVARSVWAADDWGLQSGTDTLPVSDAEPPRPLPSPPELFVDILGPTPAPATETRH
jgi:hypothetical protein